MRRGLITLAASAALLVPAAPASALESLNPTNRDFGSQTLGTAGAPASFTLTSKCFADPANPTMPTCLMNEPFSPSFSVGSDFQIVEEDCPATMPGNTVLGTSCTVKVAFRPTALGLRESILETGSLFARAAVRGTGAAVPVQPAKPKKKKCKKPKKRARSAKKRCRKKG